MTQLIIEAQIDLVNHFYALVLDIQNIQPVTKTKKRQTRLINIYNNKIGLEIYYKDDAKRI